MFCLSAESTVTMNQGKDGESPLPVDIPVSFDLRQMTMVICLFFYRMPSRQAVSGRVKLCRGMLLKGRP